ncbi:haloacid dehalogenase [Streptomyces lydicus]|uniref:Haloacid dehalogenase n=1 Tax=Streptomyces lydicus TaxID=47763 RepID=A0A3Q9K9L7_9ACTN|nr:HAD-IA family hydrolase [Streptomyces lydicus]AZS74997.1 haloacid dehalogenase [Streptomyces lydicus]
MVTIEHDCERTAAPVAAAIFDFDGVIIDSVHPDLLACSALYREYGGGELPVEWWAQEVCGQPDSYERLFSRLLAQASASAGAASQHTRAGLRRRLDELWEVYLTEDHVRLMPAVEEALDTLRAAGLPLAIASASNGRWVARWLRHYGLTQFFTAVVTCDDVPAKKPDPAVYLEALHRLGVPAEACVAFEDSHSGMAAARAAGVTVVAVPTPATRFLDHSHADAVLDDLSVVTPRWLAEVRRTAW